MITAPTPEQFLAQPVDADEDADDFTAPHGDSAAYLASIADSLQRLVAVSEGHAEQEVAEKRHRAAYDELDRAYADLDRKFDALNDLVEEVLEVCKPSVSKLANQVRETIARHREPETPSPAQDDVASSAPAVDEAAPVGMPTPDVQQRAGEGPGLPAHDAPVEAWRAYARSVTGSPEGTFIDSMNRSQIRTMLGIEQPVAPTS